MVFMANEPITRRPFAMVFNEMPCITVWIQLAAWFQHYALYQSHGITSEMRKDLVSWHGMTWGLHCSMTERAVGGAPEAWKVVAACCFRKTAVKEISSPTPATGKIKTGGINRDVGPDRTGRSEKILKRGREACCG